MTTTTTARTPTDRVAALLRRVNDVIEPLVRAGVGNSPVGPGLFVLETTGRRTGRARRVPLLGVRLGDDVVVATVRGGSQWARNLESQPAAGVWVGGHRRPVTACVDRRSAGSIARLRLDRAPT